ncbi:hypothetical protein GCM10017674_27600 [Streptomyces gardneri]|uniref:Uncharacterized protein n=1 Tax=Streptomyces gardneri TaxID=66892 RepID=A0A4Y3RQD4_9ACTN|nr:hypothetical protein SGA01_36950 [Streptomyces gardneri]GHG95751.1 hypothetical protein GCM10017674_27600 [Streptomyces gardneri]
MPSRIALSPDGFPPRWEATTDQASATRMSAGPMVRARATETHRRTIPAAAATGGSAREGREERGAARSGRRLRLALPAVSVPDGFTS